MTKLLEQFRDSAFLVGFGSALDLGATLRDLPEPSDTPWKDDAEAIRSDWVQVGRDMYAAMAVVEEKLDPGEAVSAR